MLEKIVTGGQIGADQAGWRAAKACGIATAGWMPKGFLTEDGPRSDFATLCGAGEMPTAAYPPRTRANARDSDATLWFGDTATPGAVTALNAYRRLDRPTISCRPASRSGLHTSRPGSASRSVTGCRYSSKAPPSRTAKPTC